MSETIRRVSDHPMKTSFETTPSPDAMLEPGIVMIAVGTGAELQALEEMFKPAQAVAR